MKRLIEWEPAYDRRHTDPAKNYGIGSMSIRFVLIGEHGAVQFLLFTGWHLEHVRKEHCDSPYFGEPMAADLGYHSYEPQYEGQSAITDSCPYLNGAPCYYDGSGLAAERVFETFLSGGEEALWKELEEYYHDTFGSKGDTNAQHSG